MIGPESGTYPHESLSSARIESLARHVYTLARIPIRSPPGTKRLWQSLVGPACRFEAVDIGMVPGAACVEFIELDGAVGGDGCAGATVIRMHARQTPQQWTVAYARACAIFVAWVDGVKLGPLLERAVALAIIMPEIAFREELAGPLTYGELAQSFVVDVAAIFERSKMLRGTHDSCERPAFSDSES